MNADVFSEARFSQSVVLALCASTTAMTVQDLPDFDDCCTCGQINPSSDGTSTASKDLEDSCMNRAEINNAVVLALGSFTAGMTLLNVPVLDDPATFIDPNQLPSGYQGWDLQDVMNDTDGQTTFPGLTTIRAGRKVTSSSLRLLFLF
ncbi:hypothetical protein EDC01DRAFT_629271 [Geopyxis carbonaria]|nr:hypothetical protein EDC01DRAFT_629271 [Geopyxis carbonaria]